MLLFADSFDHYTNLSLKWASGGAAIGAFGRLGTNGLRFGNATPQNISKVFAAAKTTLIAGMAFRPNAVGSDFYIFAFQDGGTTQVDVRYGTDGRLRVTRAGTTIGQGNTVLPNNVFTHIELKVTINDTTGSFELRVNGVTEVSGTNVDTKNTANATADRITLFPTGSGSAFGTADWDDVYVCDDTAPNASFLGDVRIHALLPNAAGFYAQWTPSAAVANYTTVDENPPNDDTDYISSATVGQIDSYAFTDLPANVAAVLAVQVCMDARKDDAGTREIAALVRQSAADAVGATKAVGTTYAMALQQWDTNPANAGAAWAVADLNTNAQFGVKVIA